jgi:hypothetical protein
MLLRRSAAVFSPNLDAMQVGRRVMLGQKRVEDARINALMTREFIFSRNVRTQHQN